jgi:hypothetical protein
MNKQESSHFSARYISSFFSLEADNEKLAWQYDTSGMFLLHCSEEAYYIKQKKLDEIFNAEEIDVNLKAILYYRPRLWKNDDLKIVTAAVSHQKKCHTLFGIVFDENEKPLNYLHMLNILKANDFIPEQTIFSEIAGNLDALPYLEELLKNGINLSLPCFNERRYNFIAQPEEWAFSCKKLIRYWSDQLLIAHATQKEIDNLHTMQINQKDIDKLIFKNYERLFKNK